MRRRSLGWEAAAARAVHPALAPPSPGRTVQVAEASIPELQSAMARGRTCSAELVTAYQARIAAYDDVGPRLRSMLYLNPDAQAVAEALDRERAEQGPRGPLHGIPVVVKDNFDTADMPTTGGSPALAGHIPARDAFQVHRLRAAGAVILGKANLHEMASGITSVSTLGGQTRNPYDLARNPGGSSGGTGAAIAASFAAVGWGSDTCGSIRIPAAANNLFGLRPTKGLSSTAGMIPLSRSQDVAGPLARTATDLALALDCTIGPDPADPATRVVRGRPRPRFVAALDARALRGARIGVLSALFAHDAEGAEIGTVIRGALHAMGSSGAAVEEHPIPRLNELLDGTCVIVHEFKWDLWDYLAAHPSAPVRSLSEILERGLFHPVVEERFRMRNLPQRRETAAYRAARARRSALRAAVLLHMDTHRLDALAYPSLHGKPAPIGQAAGKENCQLSAATGLPALSVPAGFTADGLPVGLELLGRPLDDARLLGFGFALEQAIHPRRSPASTPPLPAAGV